MILLFGLLSTLIGSLFALTQSRLKRLLLYSSIAQIGFLVVALGINSVQSITSLYFFLLIYLISSLLVWGHLASFLSFQSEVTLFNSKLCSTLLLSNITNFFRFHPLWAFSFSIIFFSIGGIPPLTGFTAKFLILLEVVNAEFFFLAAILIIISAVSVFYYIRVLKLVFFEPKISYKKDYSQVIISDFSSYQLYLVFSIFLISLILIFFYPGFIFLLSHYISLYSMSF
jgi:NADH:ubiquinone oxidoreductase subunit 2 (subunit N)